MFFAPVKKVLCPYCLAEIRYRNKVEKCPNGECNSDLPTMYIEKFDYITPCFAQIIGWSSVGKTVYLQALTAMLMQLGFYWRNAYAFSAQNDSTLRYTRNVRQFLSNGEMPKATQLKLQEAYIMQLEGMERWGNRTLVMRDVAGEHFNEFRFPIEQTPYLLHVPVTLMMFSLYDLKTKAFTMDELMNGYIQTLLKIDRNWNRVSRNVVMVLSKADLIANDLPQVLREYLQYDPFMVPIPRPPQSSPISGKEMHGYMNQLGYVSNIIRDWVACDPSGQTLINLAKNNNIQLRFSIVSSTGGSVGKENTMTVAIRPTRVLDPFFWILEFQSRPA